MTEYIVTWNPGASRRESEIIRKNTNIYAEKLSSTGISYLFRHIADKENDDSLESYIWDYDPLDGEYHSTLWTFPVIDGIVQDEVNPGLSLENYLKEYY